MHIEPGIVDGAKIALSYATGAGALAYAGKAAVEAAQESGVAKLGLRTVASTALVFSFFQLLPHFPVGVSEVHFILGSTLLLMFGAAPAAFGLTLGLLAQGVLFAPFDLPQFGINVTTLLVPLFAIHALASRIIPANTAYKDVSYGQALKLSTTYQAGIVGWVAFWAFYGQGFGAETLASVGTFGAAYMSVILIEPIVDLAVLALAKHMPEGVFHNRMYKSAA
jgi:ABC-type Co2+ transport system permease subunit